MISIVDAAQFAMSGFLGVLAGTEAMAMISSLRQRFEPEAKPSPPRLWSVNFTAPDGYPLRTYRLDDKQVNRLMALIHHDRDYTG